MTGDNGCSLPDSPSQSPATTSDAPFQFLSVTPPAAVSPGSQPAARRPHPGKPDRLPLRESCIDFQKPSTSLCTCLMSPGAQVPPENLALWPLELSQLRYESTVTLVTRSPAQKWRSYLEHSPGEVQTRVRPASPALTASSRSPWPDRRGPTPPAEATAQLTFPTLAAPSSAKPASTPYLTA